MKENHRFFLRKLNEVYDFSIVNLNEIELFDFIRNQNKNKNLKSIRSFMKKKQNLWYWNFAKKELEKYEHSNILIKSNADGVNMLKQWMFTVCIVEKSVNLCDIFIEKRNLDLCVKSNTIKKTIKSL